MPILVFVVVAVVLYFIIPGHRTQKFYSDEIFRFFSWMKTYNLM